MEDLADRLAAALGAARVEGLQRLTGGASRETWRFDAVRADGTVEPLVLRRDPPTRPGAPGAMGREAASIRAAAAAGLAVPELLLATDEADLWGSAGMVMRRVDGETLARRILRDDDYAKARAALTAQCGEFLAGLHAIDPATVPGLDGDDPLVAWRRTLDLVGEPSPTFELAFRWLEANRPPPTGRAIVHGDFRLGNLIVGPEGLRAVLDWELVHEGDPVEDLGWLCVRCWRFGAPLPVGGFGTREDLLAAYEAAGGAHVDAEVLRWWEVLNTLKWGIGCMGQASVHLGGLLRSVELAAIGRRVCEQEWDLLLLLTGGATGREDTGNDATGNDDAGNDDAGNDDAGNDDRGDDATTGGGEAGRGRLADRAALPEPRPDTPGLHGRPTARELLDAVEGFLRDDVMPNTTGRVSFHARVAANVVAMVARELASPTPAYDAAALAAEIRAGRWDDRIDELTDRLVTDVATKLAVANPRYF